MFWVALASLIMALTGNGDDTAAYRNYLETLREGVEEEVSDPERRAKALESIDRWHESFLLYREGLQEAAACVDALDRRYEVTRAQYLACFEKHDEHWETSVQRLLDDRDSLQALLTDAEMAALRKRASR